ncbi:MAG: hypothetical protein IPI77_16280 [Saprospiraceae bacterium]|nr:hypothetical protein [Saprospiraceae bacterium]
MATGKRTERRSISPGVNKSCKTRCSKSISHLARFRKEHSVRRNWVWFELGKSPMADALHYSVQMAAKANEKFSSSSIEAIKNYYITNGFSIDQFMRKALAAVNQRRTKPL